ncbi:MAG: carbohydrate porin [Terrimicrobiaceae bacterium]|nr:carbohydrate porin [Terrimicrobiaceae bacterium]
MNTTRIAISHKSPIAHLACLALALTALAPLHAGTDTPQPRAGEKSSAFATWLNGKYATGTWFGLRESLESRGIDIYGSWKGTFYGLTGGGLDSPHGAFDEELTLGLTLDLGKLAGIDGLTAQGSVRYRDGRSPNNYVGASSTFNPSRYQSGQQWRLMPFYLTYTTPELFGAKDFLTISGGWQNAYMFFGDQPESKLFTNNAIGTTKGIGGVNGFPWSSSYAAWGGYLKIRPVDWYYAMSGLYMAIPDATNRLNHGLDLAGFAPNPNQNGLYFLAETGFTPKIGPAKLPGKYAFGSIYWGLENRSFYGQTYDQKYTFYWQADQMLFREPSAQTPAPTAKGPSDGKTFKEEPVEPARLSEQGLYAFTFLNYAPQYDNAMPFYAHAGLVYKGLLPGRDKDQLGVAFGYGNYSFDKIVAEQDAGKSIHQTYEAVAEADYRVQVTRFVYVQPFWQYIIRPNGAGLVQNANIFGLHMCVTF